DTAPQQDSGASTTEHEAGESRHPSSASEAETIEQDRAEPPSVQQETRTEVGTERITDQEPFESVETPPLEGQAFYVTNAGLVLLWPFLGRFFKKMDLVEDKAFRTAALQQRAVLLTHFLVTGETEAPEQVLLLNKILCGWPPDATVPKSIDLTTEERDESQVLLEAAVTQWAALKNTSIAGLQQAFLQREGRLLKQPDAWTLKVDRTGYDMLLDRLPWSIAIIKQPWMPHPLFVEW
ncbi:MAG TPA: contractile injection system tape measure protein, partial [Rhodothermales bacterium]|nr:contractile injection system tape measure protein [Rhodothermales bacterium]